MVIDTIEIAGFEAAISGMRNPMKSWAKSDSRKQFCMNDCDKCPAHVDPPFNGYSCQMPNDDFWIGDKDFALAKNLAQAGPDHGKYLRQIIVWVNIKAPRYWWSEFDTYRTGVEKVSESTMHTILKDDPDEMEFAENTHPLVIERFKELVAGTKILDAPLSIKKQIVKANLPEGLMQTRTVMMSYAALRNIYKQRKNHELFEWREEFCRWIRNLPYSGLITD